MTVRISKTQSPRTWTSYYSAYRESNWAACTVWPAPSRNTSVTAGEWAGGQPRQFRLTLRSEETEALGQGDVWDWLGWWEQPPPAQDPRLCLSDKLSTCSAPLSPQWSGLSPPSLLRAHHPPAQPVLPGSFFPFIPTASASLPQPAVSLLTPQGTQGCLE